MITTFPPETRFCFPWRSYQARILAEFEKHIDDRHFHVVAAPGSGKTALGLEAVRRLNTPALVLTPGLVIRDQWISRLTELFLPHGANVDWISRDLKNPGLLTVTTYQALYADCKKISPNVTARRLIDAGVKTLVFDEAHHLRQEWWKALNDVKRDFIKPFIIALTATPPYDVTQVEWNRYRTICGEVDAEVAIPELVMEKNLCPHQDYIYFVKPSGQLQQELEHFSGHMRSFLLDLTLNSEIISAIKNHPVLTDPEQQAALILKNNEYYLSLAIFLKYAHGVAPREILECMGLLGLKLPAFNPIWGEKMLTGMLFYDRPSYASHEAALKKLERELHAYKAIEQKKVYLQVTPRGSRTLRSSPAKLKGIADITALESRICGHGLKMVILTDYIRECDFPSLHHEDKPFTKLGVVPIFDHLRRLRLPNVNLAILTGSLVVTPGHVLPIFKQCWEDAGDNPPEFNAKELWHAENYVRIESPDKSRARVLVLMTRLFARGIINVMIGTTALLGEGWDAPAVNTLILATVIGSYVSSNQIRGRAIRIDPEDPLKASNIWHLACISRETEISEYSGADDLSLLIRRFKAFPGISSGKPVIESGLERLGITPDVVHVDNLDRLNARMCRLAEAREKLHPKWQSGLYHHEARHRRMAQEVFFPQVQVKSKVVSRYLGNITANKDVPQNVLNRWLKWYLPHVRQLQMRKTRRITRSLLKAMFHQELIDTSPEKIEVKVIEGKNHIRALAVGMNLRDETLFIQSLQEIFNPTLSPRYILQTPDEVFCVPRILGEKKSRAKRFWQCWTEEMGPAELLFTKNRKGRKALLKAAQQYLVSKTEYESRSRLRWC